MVNYLQIIRDFDEYLVDHDRIGILRSQFVRLCGEHEADNSQQ